MSSQEAVRFAKRSLLRNNSVTMTAEALVAEAAKRCVFGIPSFEFNILSSPPFVLGLVFFAFARATADNVTCWVIANLALPKLTPVS